jgi:hypothetical protein
VREVYVTREAVVTTPTLYDGIAERANVSTDTGGSAKLLSPTQRRAIMRLRRGY